MHPLAAAAVLLAAAAMSIWTLLASGAWPTGGFGLGGIAAAAPALLVAGAAAGFANSGST
jgi:hypothetical protein